MNEEQTIAHEKTNIPSLQTFCVWFVCLKKTLCKHRAIPGSRI